MRGGSARRWLRVRGKCVLRPSSGGGDGAPRAELTPFAAVLPSALSHRVFPSRFPEHPLRRVRPPTGLMGGGVGRMRGSLPGTDGAWSGKELGWGGVTEIPRGAFRAAGIVPRYRTRPPAPVGNGRCRQRRRAEAPRVRGGRGCRGSAEAGRSRAGAARI